MTVKRTVARQWMPIETAPKDGSILLLATPRGRVADGMWSTRYKVWAWPYVMVEPTHWRPAIKPPTHSKAPKINSLGEYLNLSDEEKIQIIETGKCS